MTRKLPSDRIPRFSPNGSIDPFDGSTTLAYIKLHGSVNWRSHDDRNCIVVGTRKSDQIVNEPLLNQYFELFEEVLCRPGNRLLVIGYGFRDTRINDVIHQAVSTFGLELYVANRMRDDEFKATCRPA